MERFLDNPAIRVKDWYGPIAREWLSKQYTALGEIRLIVDGTKVGYGHQLLMISMPYRKRAIPIAWTWAKHIGGHSTGTVQIALLAYVKSILPDNATDFLVGDTEFGPIKVLKQLEIWHRCYVLCQKSDTSVWSKADHEWKSFGSFVQNYQFSGPHHRTSFLYAQNVDRRIVWRFERSRFWFGEYDVA